MQERHLELAREGFDRAWELDPESPLLHNLYTYYQLEELADGRGAMLRLLERLKEQPTEANLWAGLVPACRFQGLYAASMAAHERARTLDPKIKTSVEHTYMQLGEFGRALEKVPEQDAIYLQAMMKGRQGDDAGVIDLLERALEMVGGSPARTTPDFEGMREYYIGAPLDALQGRPAEAETKLREIHEIGVRDPEAILFLARTAARADAVELSLEFVETMIERGYYAIEGLERDPWFDSLRGEPRFKAAFERAREGQQEAVPAFREAGGPDIVGVAEPILGARPAFTAHLGG